MAAFLVWYLCRTSPLLPQSAHQTRTTGLEGLTSGGGLPLQGIQWDKAPRDFVTRIAARPSASDVADHSGPMRRRRTTTTWGERVGGAQSRAGRESVRFGALLRTWDRTWSSGTPIRPATMATCCSGSAARSYAAAMASSIVGGSWRTRGGPENLGGLDLERTGGNMIGPYPITSSLCSAA